MLQQSLRAPSEDSLHSLDSLDIGEAHVRDTTRRHEFLSAYTSLETLKSPCSEYRRCNSRLCPSCDSRHAAAARRRLHVPASSRAIQLTLTLADSDDVTAGFKNLDMVRREFERLLRGHHLVVAYVVSFELTVPHSWHWHLHAAVFGNDLERLDLERLAHELPDLWIESARSSGFHASSYAQNALLRDQKGALAYVVKGKLNRRPGSLWDLLGRAADGEDEAVAHWEDFESHMQRGDRWLSTWHMRPPKESAKKDIPQHSTSDRQLMMLADLLGATSKRVQAGMPTTMGRSLSTSTISRIRRDDSVYRRWRTLSAEARGLAKFVSRKRSEGSVVSRNRAR